MLALTERQELPVIVETEEPQGQLEI